MTRGKLLREPLLHFILLGIGLFLLSGRLGGDTRSDRITLTRGELDQILGAWERTWQRPPTEAEVEGLVNDWVREQVYAREAIALGLGENDVVIRRRLRQKIEFMVNDLADAVPPTEAELAAFLAADPGRFSEPVRVTFRQVYVSVDRRGRDAWPEAERLREELRGAGGVPPGDAGDPLAIEPFLENASERDVARLFGADFAAAVLALEPGDWRGPIESGYGLHLVRISGRIEPPPPILADVRSEVTRELRMQRRRDVTERVYEEIRSRYEVVVETGNPNAR